MLIWNTIILRYGDHDYHRLDSKVRLENPDMIWQKPLNDLVERIQTHPHVTGIVLFGSLAAENPDALADIDLGITTPDDAPTLDDVFQVGYEFFDPLGLPIQTVERDWEHCKMIAALFSKSAYPPVGLEVDLVFSQTQHVGEQFQYAPYKILYDKDGRLKSALDKAIQTRPSPDDLMADIHAQLKAFPFLLHDALKALHRDDRIAGEALITDMRLSILKLAAANHQERLYTLKNAARWLESHQSATFLQPLSQPTIVDLAAQFEDQLRRIDANSPLAAEIRTCRQAIDGLLE